MKCAKKILGVFGEEAAAEYLKKKRYKILCRNYSSKFGEIDIIAEKKKNIIFIEVKTRNDNTFGTPAESVTYAKQQKIMRCAKWYMTENNLNRGARFDVIEVYAKPCGDDFVLDKINHIEGAFVCDGIYM